MTAAAQALAEIARKLPTGSAVRERITADAERWASRAALRGMA